VTVVGAEHDIARHLASFLVRIAGAVQRPRRDEFVGELDFVQSMCGQSGLGFAAGALVGAAVERIVVGNGFHLVDVSKQYASTQAVRGVSLDVPGGSICALLGGNGAGKSTLLRLIAGREALDSGEILIGETPISTCGHGCATAIIPSSLELFDELTVAENIALGARRGRWVIDTSDESAVARSLLTQLGSSLDPTMPLRSLPVQDKVVVAIARALAQGRELILLDEPVGGISDNGPVLHALLALREAGCAVIYVTHRIDDALSVADQVAVVRDGELVFDAPAKEADAADLVRLIVGDQATDSARVAVNK
jgi:ABC-type sugar transport system ATPase subunit